MAKDDGTLSILQESHDSLPAQLNEIFIIPSIFNRPDRCKLNLNPTNNTPLEAPKKRKIGICRFSPYESILAVSMQNECSVAIWSYNERNFTNIISNPLRFKNKTDPVFSPSTLQVNHTKSDSVQAHLLCTIRHSRPVQDLLWLEKHDSANQGQIRLLQTRTTDGVSRLWTTTIDDMYSMHLTSIISEKEKEQQAVSQSKAAPHHVFGKGVECWDAIQELSIASTQMRNESTLFCDSCPFSWNVLKSDKGEREIPILALVRGKRLSIFAPRRLTFWQRCLMACNMTRINFFLPKPPSSFSKVSQSRMDVIATARILGSSQTSEKKEEKESIESVHWISDDHLLAGMREGQEALILEGVGKQSVDNSIEEFEDDEEHKKTQEDEIECSHARSISQIARTRSEDLPLMHPEYLIRLVYWGQLPTALQAVYRACRLFQDRETRNSSTRSDDENKGVEFDELEVCVHAAPAERQMEVERLVADDEEQIRLTLRVSEGEEGLRKLMTRMIVKDEYERKENNKKRADLDQSDGHTRQSSILVAHALLDLRQFVGQLDDNAIRFVLNALSPSIYHDQEGKDASFNSPLNPLISSESQIQAPSLSNSLYTDSYLLKMCLHAWFSSTQEALLQYMQTSFLIGLSEKNQIAADGRDDTTIKLNWPIARQTGIFLWLRSNDQLRTVAENIARVQYSAGDQNDPTACALIYYALGKAKLMVNLWRQAVWHPEYSKMMQFLRNDFSEARWRTAAKKNAFVLLSQRRFEMAAAFFLLGDSLEDAVNVCVRNLHDVSLAIALCRIWHVDKVGQTVLRDLVLQVILPIACKSKDRYTLLWISEIMGRRELSTIIIQSQDLVSAAKDVAKAFDIDIVKESNANSVSLQESERDTDDIFFFKSIVASPNSILENQLVDTATDILQQDGMSYLAKAVKEKWHSNDGKTTVPTYSLFESKTFPVAPQQIKINRENEEANKNPVTFSAQPMKSEMAKQKPAASVGDLEFNLDQWNM